MRYVRPKKRLGQHFLNDQDVACKIVEALSSRDTIQNVLEIGPGTGVLSGYLFERSYDKVILLDVDKESIAYLHEAHPKKKDAIIHGDFLKCGPEQYFGDHKYAIIGNFPYNISSQIFFKVLEEKETVQEVVCMIQKEVAERIASPHGSRTYGILSVLLQAYYTIEYLFTVEPHVFIPPPKVRSGVIKLKRNNVVALDCDEVLFKRVVKEGFQKRRKTLRNALKALNLPEDIQDNDILNKRAEQLSVEDFIQLTNLISPK